MGYFGANPYPISYPKNKSVPTNIKKRYTMIKYRIYVDTTKKHKDGNSPVTLIFENKGHRAKVNTGLLSSCKFTGREFPKEEPNARFKTAALTRLLSSVDSILLSHDNDDAFDDVIDEVKSQAIGSASTSSSKRKKVFTDYCAMFAETKTNTSTRSLYASTIRKVQEFDASATFDTMTKDWLQKFETYWLKTMQINGLAIQMRNIRAVFNWAIDNEYTDKYPFRKFVIKQERTRPNNISVKELREVRDCDLGNDWREVWRDMFMLSFYLCGINPGDMYYLTDDNYKDGYITYKRMKTGRIYKIPVYQEAKDIIDRYRGKKHLLSVFDRYSDKGCAIQHWNRTLKKIGSLTMACDKLGRHTKPVYQPIVEGMTVYTARYTFASIGAELDIPRETIALCLGHSWADVTSHYIAYEQKKIDDAVKKILDYVSGE